MFRCAESEIMPAAVFVRGVHAHLSATVSEHIAEHIFEIDSCTPFTTPTRHLDIDAFVTAIQALPPVSPAPEDEGVAAGLQQRMEEEQALIREELRQVKERLTILENRGDTSTS